MEAKSDYQRRLAESLIRSMGIEEATDFAIRNQWMGVLAHLPTPMPAALSRPGHARVDADFAPGS